MKMAGFLGRQAFKLFTISAHHLSSKSLQDVPAEGPDKVSTLPSGNVKRDRSH